MRKLHLELGERSYPIYITTDTIGQVKPLSAHLSGKQVALVTNTTVAPLYLECLEKALVGYQLIRIVLCDGESFKNWQTLQLIFDALLEAHFGREATLIALGGGVIGDMTGFAAATYQRGIRFIQIPTTLLSQVDSSVGGKTAINHPLGKNMIGAFHQPKAVLIDTSTLKTLPKAELLAGLAEVIKYGVIRDVSFLEWLETHVESILSLDADALSEMIAWSCSIKAQVVELDECESGIRELLNLGHTFGHAIEAHIGYGDWLHGEAVAVGMVMALEMSRLLGFINLIARDRVVRLLHRVGLPVIPPSCMGEEDFLRYMVVDKKVKAGRIRLVLVKELGHAVVLSDYPQELLQSVFSADYQTILEHAIG